MPPAMAELTLASAEGEPITLRLRRNPKARRLVLRFDARSDSAILTLPRGISRERGLAFAREKQGWVLARRRALGPRVPFVEGGTIPFRGSPLILRRLGPREGPPRIETGILFLPARAEHFAGALQRWLRKEARHVLGDRCEAMASRLGRNTPALRINDPASRWGSCSAAGRLSFSWRLILAPDFVLDYVSAHETAHLLEMNHGPRFHALVRSLTPEADAARAWLRAEGGRLHRYG